MGLVRQGGLAPLADDLPVTTALDARIATGLTVIKRNATVLVQVFGMSQGERHKAGRQSYPFAAYFAVALAAIVAGAPDPALEQYRPSRLIDTDDAMRLDADARLARGQGWFDLQQKRMSFPPALPYESHWSRLVDAGLRRRRSSFFNAFAEHALSERLLRVVWPLLFIAPALGGVCAIAWRLAGREAALADTCCSRSPACRPISNSGPAASIITMCRSR